MAKNSGPHAGRRQFCISSLLLKSNVERESGIEKMPEGRQVGVVCTRFLRDNLPGAERLCEPKGAYPLQPLTTKCRNSQQQEVRDAASELDNWPVRDNEHIPTYCRTQLSKRQILPIHHVLI